jgi:hypothetical protein
MRSGKVFQSNRWGFDPPYATNHAIPEGEAIVTGQAMQDGHVPLDEVVGFLNNRQFFRHG